jgi:hypothetical protein
MLVRPLIVRASVCFRAHGINSERSSGIFVAERVGTAENALKSGKGFGEQETRMANQVCRFRPDFKWCIKVRVLQDFSGWMISLNQFLWSEKWLSSLLPWPVDPAHFQIFFGLTISTFCEYEDTISRHGDLPTILNSRHQPKGNLDPLASTEWDLL